MDSEFKPDALEDSEGDSTPRLYELDTAHTLSKPRSGILVASPFSHTIKLNTLCLHTERLPSSRKENASDEYAKEARRSRVLLREKDREIAELQAQLARQQQENAELRQLVSKTGTPADRVVQSLEGFKSKLQLFIASKS